MLSTFLLFNAYTDHNSQASPTPWSGKQLGKDPELQYGNKSQSQLYQENQCILVHYCMTVNRDVSTKFFGNGTGWSVDKLDPIWASSLRYYKQLSGYGIVSSFPSSHVNENGKRVEGMWIHHFVILQMFHRRFLEHDNPIFKNENYTSFVKLVTNADWLFYYENNNKYPKFMYMWATDYD
jgi:hypothetical protein